MKHIYFIDDKIDTVEPLIVKALAYYADNQNQVKINLIAVVQDIDIQSAENSCNSLQQVIIGYEFQNCTFDYQIVSYSGEKDEFYTRNNSKTCTSIINKINQSPCAAAIDLMLLDNFDLRYLNKGKNKILSHALYEKLINKCVLYSDIEEMASDVDFECWLKPLGAIDARPSFYATKERQNTTYLKFWRELFTLAK